MSRTAKLEVDTHQLTEMFAELTGKEMKAAERRALRKSANILVAKARSILRQKVGSITHDHVGKNGKHYKLSRGFGVSVSRDAKEAKVNIMKDFRLKFFEMGTDGRYVLRRGSMTLRKKAYRGRIRKDKYEFFKTAQEASRSRVFDEMGTRVAQEVKRINDKKRQ